MRYCNFDCPNFDIEIIYGEDGETVNAPICHLFNEVAEIMPNAKRERFVEVGMACKAGLEEEF